MPFQMAFDEILFRRMENESLPCHPILRFYFSSEPWVTVGYSYGRRIGKTAANTSAEAGDLRASGDLPVCRRMTGGGRVLHGEDLIFAVIAQKNQDESFSSVRVSYWKIHEAVKFGFETLGQRPRFFRCDENLPPGEDCFRFPITTDLGIGERKIAGGAQKRSKGVLLHQESVRIPRGIEGEDLIEAIQQGFKNIFGIQLIPNDLVPEWLAEAEGLAKIKYRQNERTGKLS